MATSIPTFPSIDFSKLDLGKLDLSNLGWPFTGAQTEQVASKVAGILRDTAYVVIGFSVLTLQQAQVRRRELVDTLTDNVAVQQMGVTRTQIEELVAGLEAGLSKLDERLVALEGKLDAAIETTVDRLPEQAGALVEQAHEIAKVARKQVRSMIRTAA